MPVSIELIHSTHSDLDRDYFFAVNMLQHVRVFFVLTLYEICANIMPQLTHKFLAISCLAIYSMSTIKHYIIVR